MRAKLATGSCKSRPHQSKIKGFNNQWEKKIKSQFNVKACPDVCVQCMCALINWGWLEFGLAFWSCALLTGPVDEGVRRPLSE